MSFNQIQLYLHVIIAVKGRDHFIQLEQTTEIEDYLLEMLQINGHTVHAVTCMPDHLHLLISWNPTFTVDAVVDEIKQLSKHYIRYKKWNEDFEWQDGYRAFSISDNEVEEFTKYIQNQHKYHQRKTFRQEFIELLELHELEYEESELFEFYN